MSGKTKGTLLMALCAAMWSTGGVLTKLIPWNSMTIAGFRSLIAAAIIGLFMLASHKKMCINRRSLAISIALAGMAFCYISATKFTTAANAITLQYTAPVFLLLYQALFQHKKLRVPDYLVVFVALGGIALFFLDQLGGGTLLGNCIAIVSGLFYAGYFLTTGEVEENTRFSGLFAGNVLAAVIGVPTMFLFDTPFTQQSVIGILALGIVQLGLSYVVYAFAARTCPPLSCALLSALEVLLNPVWVFFTLGELPGPTALLGGAVVIIGVTLWTIWDGRQTAVSAVPEK